MGHPPGDGGSGSRLRAAAAAGEPPDGAGSLVSSNLSEEYDSAPSSGQALSAEEEPDESKGGQKTDLKALLAVQLSEVQRLLEEHHQQALQAAQKERLEAVRRVEEEASECRRENQRLRATLSFAGLNEAGGGEKSAGTGESSSHPGCLPPSPQEEDEEDSPPPGVPERMKRTASGPQLRFAPSVIQKERERDSFAPSVIQKERERDSIATEVQPAVAPPRPAGVPATPSGRPSILDVPRSASPARGKKNLCWTPNRTSESTEISRGSTGGPVEELWSNRSSMVQARRFQADCDLHRQNARSAFSDRGSKSALPGKTMRKTIRTHPNALFADADELKQRVRQAICVKEYHVFDCYKDTGPFQFIAKTQAFELCTLGVILANALWMCFDTDSNTASVLPDAAFHFQFAEHFFCTYFTCEAIIRFCAFRRTLDAFKDAWFVFDTLLVLLMIVETWVITGLIVFTGQMHNDSSLGDAAILKTLRLMRLTRMARVVRLLRACPEVMILIKGIVIASPSVFFTLVLLVCMIYVFGIAFTELARGTTVGAEYFESVPSSMATLLLNGCFGENLPDVVYMLGAENFFLAALLMVFVLFASLMVMNMLMAALVEVVQVVSSVEKETIVVQVLKVKMQSVIEDLEPGFDGMISQFLFAQLVESPVVIKALADHGVDVMELIDFKDYIFDQGDTVDFAKFMDLTLQLRGTNKATLKDIIDLRKRLVQEVGRIEQHILQIPKGPLSMPSSPVGIPPRVPEDEETEV